jgi:hypothetical protein
MDRLELLDSLPLRTVMIAVNLSEDEREVLAALHEAERDGYVARRRDEYWEHWNLTSAGEAERERLAF